MYHFVANADEPLTPLIINCKNVVPAHIRQYLKCFQVDAIRFIFDRLQKRKFSVLNDETGLGKTATMAVVLGAIAVKNKKCLIIVQNEDYQLLWQFHLSVLANATVSVINDEKDTTNTPYNVYIAKWSTLRVIDDLSKFNFNFDYVVVDERGNILNNSFCCTTLLKNFDKKVDIVIASRDITADLKLTHNILRLGGYLELKYENFKAFEQKYKLPDSKLVFNRQIDLESYFSKREILIDYCREFRLRRYKYQFETLMPLCSNESYKINLELWRDINNTRNNRSTLRRKTINNKNSTHLEKDTEELFDDFQNVREQQRAEQLENNNVRTADRVAMSMSMVQIPVNNLLNNLCESNLGVIELSPLVISDSDDESDSVKITEDLPLRNKRNSDDSDIIEIINLVSETADSANTENQNLQQLNKRKTTTNTSSIKIITKTPIKTPTITPIKVSNKINISTATPSKTNASTATPSKINSTTATPSKNNFTTATSPKINASTATPSKTNASTPSKINSTTATPSKNNTSTPSKINSTTATPSKNNFTTATSPKINASTATPSKTNVSTPSKINSTTATPSKNNTSTPSKINSTTATPSKNDASTPSKINSATAISIKDFEQRPKIAATKEKLGSQTKTVEKDKKIEAEKNNALKNKLNNGVQQLQTNIWHEKFIDNDRNVGCNRNSLTQNRKSEEKLQVSDENTSQNATATISTIQSKVNAPKLSKKSELLLVLGNPQKPQQSPQKRASKVEISITDNVRILTRRSKSEEELQMKENERILTRNKKSEVELQLKETPKKTSPKASTINSKVRTPIIIRNRRSELMVKKSKEHAQKKQTALQKVPEIHTHLRRCDEIKEIARESLINDNEITTNTKAIEAIQSSQFLVKPSTEFVLQCPKIIDTDAILTPNKNQQEIDKNDCNNDISTPIYRNNQQEPTIDNSSGYTIPKVIITPILKSTGSTKRHIDGSSTPLTRAKKVKKRVSFRDNLEDSDADTQVSITAIGDVIYINYDSDNEKETEKKRETKEKFVNHQQQRKQERDINIRHFSTRVQKIQEILRSRFAATNSPSHTEKLEISIHAKKVTEDNKSDGNKEEEEIKLNETPLKNNEKLKRAENVVCGERSPTGKTCKVNVSRRTALELNGDGKAESDKQNKTTPTRSKLLVTAASKKGTNKTNIEKNEITERVNRNVTENEITSEVAETTTTATNDEKNENRKIVETTPITKVVIVTDVKMDELLKTKTTSSTTLTNKRDKKRKSDEIPSTTIATTTIPQKSPEISTNKVTSSVTSNKMDDEEEQTTVNIKKDKVRKSDEISLTTTTTTSKIVKNEHIQQTETNSQNPNKRKRKSNKITTSQSDNDDNDGPKNKRARRNSENQVKSLTKVVGKELPSSHRNKSAHIKVATTKRINNRRKSLGTEFDVSGCVKISITPRVLLNKTRSMQRIMRSTVQKNKYMHTAIAVNMDKPKQKLKKKRKTNNNNNNKKKRKILIKNEIVEEEQKEQEKEEVQQKEKEIEIEITKEKNTNNEHEQQNKMASQNLTQTSSFQIPPSSYDEDILQCGQKLSLSSNIIFSSNSDISTAANSSKFLMPAVPQISTQMATFTISDFFNDSDVIFVPTSTATLIDDVIMLSSSTTTDDNSIQSSQSRRTRALKSKTHNKKTTPQMLSTTLTSTSTSNLVRNSPTTRYRSEKSPDLFSNCSDLSHMNSATFEGFKIFGSEVKQQEQKQQQQQQMQDKQQAQPGVTIVAVTKATTKEKRAPRSCLDILEKMFEHRSTSINKKKTTATTATTTISETHINNNNKKKSNKDNNSSSILPIKPSTATAAATAAGNAKGQQNQQKQSTVTKKLETKSNETNFNEDEIFEITNNGTFGSLMRLNVNGNVSPVQQLNQQQQQQQLPTRTTPIQQHNKITNYLIGQTQQTTPNVTPTKKSTINSNNNNNNINSYRKSPKSKATTTTQTTKLTKWFHQRDALDVDLTIPHISPTLSASDDEMPIAMAYNKRRGTRRRRLELSFKS